MSKTNPLSSSRRVRDSNPHGRVSGVVLPPMIPTLLFHLQLLNPPVHHHLLNLMQWIQPAARMVPRLIVPLHPRPIEARAIALQPVRVKCLDVLPQRLSRHPFFRVTPCCLAHSPEHLLLKQFPVDVHSSMICPQ